MVCLEFSSPFGPLVSWRVGGENKELFNTTGTVGITHFLHKMKDLTILSFTSSLTKILIHLRKFQKLHHIGAEDLD